jgi:hypothetical protein
MDDPERKSVKQLKTDDGPADQPLPLEGRGVSRRALLIGAGLIAAAGAGIAIARAVAPEQDSTASSLDPESPATSSTTASLAEPDTSRTSQSGSAGEKSLSELARPALPARAVSMWINTFERPTVAELPADVRETVNLVIFAMAQSAASGTGILKWEPGYQSYDDIAKDISRLTAADKPVLLGIGGSNDG